MWHFPAMFDYPTVGALDSAVRLFRRAVATPSRQQWRTVLPPRGSGDDRGRLQVSKCKSQCGKPTISKLPSHDHKWLVYGLFKASIMVGLLGLPH